jgi:hypothetical protein
LIFFIAGQVILYAHQHQNNNGVGKVSSLSFQQTITQKCQLCDAMHHNNTVLTHHVYFQPIVFSHWFFVNPTYDFISLSLILSSGRAPPVFS